MTEIILYACVLVTGLYAGIHFFNLVAGVAAIRRMERPETFIDFWQNIDHFMAARMRVFGPLVLALLLATTALLAAEGHGLAAAFAALAFMLALLDAVFAVNGNMPLNQRVQSWSLERPPAEWQAVRAEAARWFGRRGLAAIGALASIAVAMLVAIHPSDPALAVVVVASFVAIMASGLYGGMHLFAFMGLMPAYVRMTRPITFVESCQTIDAIMGRRMARIGPAILTALLAVAVVLLASGHALAGIIASGAFALVAVDAALVVVRAHPIHRAINDWSPLAPPVDWQRQRARLVQTSLVRGGFAIGAYALTVVVGLTAV